AKATYLRITKEVAPVPALAYRRLGLLALQDDLKQAQAYLEQAREVEPQNLDTLYALGEVYFANGHVQKAVDAWESFLKAPGGAGDETVQARLEVAREVAPLAKAAQHDPSEANLLAYADALWQREERQQAVSVYFRVLTQQDPNQPVALSRIGQLLFFGGRTDDAIAVLERAREADGQNLDTLLFLGNAYFSKNRYQDAIDAWQDYVMAAGGPEKAGRVPALIDNARARLAGGAPAPAPEAASGQALFAQNCASCHGPAGQGGAGPRLAGNPRLADDSYVRQTIRNGRGMMPAFGGRLSETQLSSLIGYLQQAFAPSEAAQGQ
ncbi:MAG TPA: c-type cytochrome, partial [Trueperaceae bacterium]